LSLNFENFLIRFIFEKVSASKYPFRQKHFNS
jgi:hypothetical protein